VHDAEWKKRVAYPTIISVVGITLSLYYQEVLLALAFLGVSAGYVLGRFITPDADQLTFTRGSGLLMQKFGFFGLLIAMWFMPYAYMLKYIGLGGRKGHRSTMSHGIIIGTVFRLAWLLLPAALAALWSGLAIPAVVAWFFLGVLAGLSLSDYIHIAADFAYFPFTKRKRRL